MSFTEVRKLVKEQEAAFAAPTPYASYATKVNPELVMVMTDVQTDSLFTTPVVEPASPASQTPVSSTTSSVSATTSTNISSTNTISTSLSYSLSTALTKPQQINKKNDNKTLKFYNLS